MEWISVKDRLPDDYDADYIVLVTNLQRDEDGNIPACFRIGLVCMAAWCIVPFFGFIYLIRHW